MTVYSFYLFNRQGVCLISRRFHQQPRSAVSLAHEERLLWGLLFSLKDFSNRLSLKSQDLLEKNALQSFATNDYKVHYYETLTGLRLILCTDHQTTLKSSVGNSFQPANEPLLAIYRLYVDTLMNNPFYKPSSPIECPIFQQKLEQLLESLPYFAPPPGPAGATAAPTAATGEKTI